MKKKNAYKDPVLDRLLQPFAQKICDEHGISFEAVFVERRQTKRATAARDHFVAVVRWSTELSLREIAAVVGRGDASDMNRAIARYERRLNPDLSTDRSSEVTPRVSA